MHPCSRLPLALALLLAALSAPAQDAYWLFSSSDHQPLELLVNGFPLKEMPGTNAVSSTGQLDPYLVAGTNLISVRFLDNTNTLAAGSRLVRLRLERGPAKVSPRQKIFELNRSAELLHGIVTETLDFFGGKQFQFNLRHTLDGVASWQSLHLPSSSFESRYLTNSTTNVVELRLHLPNARLTNLPWAGAPVALTPADRADLTALVSSLHGLLSTRNYDGLITNFQAKVERLALATGLSVAEQQNQLRQLYIDLAGDNLVWDPFEPTQLEFKSYPGVNLVQLHIQGRPPITGRAPNYRFGLPLLVSKLNGRWTVVE